MPHISTFPTPYHHMLWMGHYRDANYKIFQSLFNQKLHAASASADSLSLPEEEKKGFLRLKFTSSPQLASDGLGDIRDFVQGTIVGVNWMAAKMAFKEKKSS